MRVSGEFCTGWYSSKTIGPWKLGQIWHVAMTHAIVKHARTHVKVIAKQKEEADAAP